MIIKGTPCSAKGFRWADCNLTNPSISSHEWMKGVIDLDYLRMVPAITQKQGVPNSKQGRLTHR